MNKAVSRSIRLGLTLVIVAGLVLFARKVNWHTTWRNIARVSNQRNVVASLIVGAFHTGGQSTNLNKEAFPLAELT